MKILLYTWLHEFTIKDIIESFQNLSINYDVVSYDVFHKNKAKCPELFNCIYSRLSEQNYDAVFSVNYFPDVAKACFEKNTLYISWTYDCPLDIENIEDTINLSTNRAFFFDKEQCEELGNINNTVFHFPLAVNSKRASKSRFTSSYSSEISFVGRIYHSAFPTLTKYLDEYNLGYLSGLIEAQKNIYGSYLCKSILTTEYLNNLNDLLKKQDCPFTKDNNVSNRQLAYLLATEATFENRLLCLGLLSKYYDLKWYTTNDSETLSNIHKCPPVDYLTEMPLVFKSSKINLHIGLHSIPSGISLRQLDIMSCGGFLLSSFQPELFDYFIPGEDFDYFSSPEEALDKARFYLLNDSIRKKIVQSGAEKTNKIFSYSERLPKLLDLAMK